MTMPKTKFFPLALSPQAAAVALSVPARIVREAIRNGELEAHTAPSGKRVRILVADLVLWVREWWPRYNGSK